MPEGREAWFGTGRDQFEEFAPQWRICCRRASAMRTKQPYRALQSASLFVDGKRLDYVVELITAQRTARSGVIDVDSTPRLFVKRQSGRAFGFADNMAFVGILSALLLYT